MSQSDVQHLAGQLIEICEALRRLMTEGEPPDLLGAASPKIQSDCSRLEDSGDGILLSRAKHLLHSRRHRGKVFAAYPHLFGEPAFDVLLDLFVALAEDKRVSISSAAIAACVPPTTALRWLTSLQKMGLIFRTPDHHDARRSYVALTNEGRSIMTRYLEGVS